jgi:hypothetical protein
VRWFDHTLIRRSLKISLAALSAVARSSWKADAGARPNGFATRVGYEHELALKITRGFR